LGRNLELFTNQTITNIGELLAQLKQIRVAGFAFDEGEHTAGVYCTAVPIRDHRKEVIAAMSVSVPSVRNSPQTRLKILQTLQHEASLLSRTLGCPGEAA